MTELTRTIQRARWRAVAGEAIGHSGLGLAAGAAAGLALLAGDRVLGLALPLRTYAALAGLGWLIGSILAIARRPGPLHVAVRLDRTLGLKDRLATATALSGEAGRRTHVDPAVASMVQRDAERVAGSIDVRSAIPLRLPPVWIAAAGLGGVLWAGALFLPSASATPAPGEVAAPEKPQEREQRERLASALDDAVDEIRDDPGLDQATQERLDALERLAEQLGNPSADPQEVAHARDESAASLEELAERMAEQARRDQETLDRLAERFAGTDPAQELPAAEGLTDALRRGQFDQAADELEDLLDRGRSLSEEERRDLADSLRRLGQELDEANQTAVTSQSERQAQLEEVLADQGLEEPAVDELLDSPPPRPEEIEQALEERGVDEEVARQIARDLQELHEEQELQRQLEEQTRELSRTIEEAAEQVENPPEKLSPPETNRPDPGEPLRPSEPPAEGQAQPHQLRPNSQPSQPGDQPGDAPKPGETQGQPGQAPADRPSEMPSEKPTAEPADQPGQRPQEEPAGGQPGQDETPATPGDAEQAQGQRQDRQETAPGQNPTEIPSQEPGAEPSQRPDGARPTPGGAETLDGAAPQTPDQDRPSGSETPSGAERPRPDQIGAKEDQPDARGSPGEESPATPSEALRRLAERRQTAEERRRRAERLRSIAREVAERMSPEERRRWMEQWSRQESARRGAGREGEGLEPSASPPPLNITDVENVDARGDDPADQVLHQWLDPEAPQPPAADASTTSPAARIRRARALAERAVEEGAVPRRYRQLIRRYFQRLPETFDRASDERGGETSRPAKDDS